MIKFILSKKRFIKFGIVGGLGTLTNLLIFFIFVDYLKLSKLIFQFGNFNIFIINININIYQQHLFILIGFIVAATQNYLLNHIWTFKVETKDKKISINGWFKFILTSLVGLLINLVVFHYIDHYFKLPYKVIAQFFGIGAGMIFNFLGSKFFVFRKKKEITL